MKRLLITAALALLSTPVLAATPVTLTDAAGNKVGVTGGALNIQGPVTGAFSNASDGVSTTSTNLPSISYNFGFDGATWDRMRVSPTTFNLLAQAPGATHVQSGALAASLVVKNAAATLTNFTVSADSTLYATEWYVMVFDATSLPVNGAVTPAKCYPVPAGTQSYGASSLNIAFTTGITIGVSTTGCFTITTSTHAAFIGGDYIQ